MSPKPLLSAAALTAVFAISAATGATILTGTGEDDNWNIPENHHSNLPGTPNIALKWSPVDPSGGGGYDGWQAYSDGGWTTTSSTIGTGTGVYQMGMGESTETDYDILFTPDAGFAVKLNSVDIDIYSVGWDWTMTATIFDSTGTIALAPVVAMTPSASDPDGNSTWELDFTGAIGEAVLLRFEIQGVGRTGGYIAMDNLSFDQVPEPSVALLGGLGAFALLRRRR